MLGCTPGGGASEANGSAASGSTGSQTKTEVAETIYVEAEKPVEKTEEIDTDIVIIGSGIAGMSAALQASLGKAKVTVLEKHTVGGGNSSLCGGNFYCCGSKKQDELGYSDYGTPEEVAQFYYDRSEGDASMEMCRLVAERGGEAMDWLVSFGCDFDKKPGEGISDRCMVSTTKGKGIVDVLTEEATKNGTEVMMETRAIEIIMDGGKATGVRARKGSTEYIVNAKAVIMASGGFDGQSWSKAMYAPGVADWHTYSSPGNTGDGIELAKQAGALTMVKCGFDQVHQVGKTPIDSHSEASTLRMINTGVYISDLGYRCANESMNIQFDYLTPFVRSGRNSFFIICDSQQSEKRMSLLEEGVELGAVHKADTLEELIEMTGVPPYPAKKTLERYNALCEQGEDVDFGKDPADLQKIEQGPFYAVQIIPSTTDSFGSLPITTKTEVVDPDRNPIPGLYAAGTIGNVELFYEHYPISGASLCMGTVSGRIAAEEAIKYYGG